MECELKKPEEEEEGRGQSLEKGVVVKQNDRVSLLEQEVKAATDLLVLTNFSACLDACQSLVSSVKACRRDVRHDSDSGIVQRLDKVLEAVTVIGIQSLAEQGEWREVIPFVESVYTCMDACPAAIMQMCLLLHAHVREYLVCHSLVEGWMDWGDHSRSPGSGPIITAYVTNVLAPLGAYNLIPQIVERCAVLTSEERQALLSPRPPSSPSLSASSSSSFCCSSSQLCLTSGGHLNSSEDLPPPAADSSSSSLGSASQHHSPCVDHLQGKSQEDTRPKGVRIVSLYLSVARRLWRALMHKGWCQQLLRASKMFFLLSFILLALLHVQTDVTANFTRAIEMWKMAVEALYKMWRRPSNKLQ